MKKNDREGRKANSLYVFFNIYYCFQEMIIIADTRQHLVLHAETATCE